jgi:hypothetical protein
MHARHGVLALLLTAATQGPGDPPADQPKAAPLQQEGGAPIVAAAQQWRSARWGLTWGKVSEDKRRRTVLVSCHGLPRPEGGDCDAYMGDTPCGTQLPVLCLKRDGAPRPNYAVVGRHQAMPREYYQGWAGGKVALTHPVPGFELGSRAAADALCAAELGEGYRMAEFHDGRYVEGMSHKAYHGKTWPPEAELHSGGWAFHAYGSVAGRTRFWVRISDQPANCWDTGVRQSPVSGR